MKRLRRSMVWLALGGTLLLVLLTFVFPTRTFLAQRTSIGDATRQLEVLDAQNRALDDQAARLQSDAEIERLAREQYNLVRPGEEAYAVLPAPGAQETTTPTTTPVEEEKKPKGLLSKAWHHITSLF